MTVKQVFWLSISCSWFVFKVYHFKVICGVAVGVFLVHAGSVVSPVSMGEFSVPAGSVDAGSIVRPV